MIRAYTVHAPPGPAEPAPDSERLAFVKDGISWPALFLPILWIFWHRLWLTLVWYVVFVLAVAWIGRLINQDVAGIVAVVGAVLFALEANNIRRLSLISRGWRETGGSFGRNLEEAEARYFGLWDIPSAARALRADAPAPGADLRSVPAEVQPARSAERRNLARGRSDEPIFGLFPEPER